MKEKVPSDCKIPANRFADLILEVCVILLESGAHCERINRNVQRLAMAVNFRVDIFLSFTAVSVSVVDLKDNENSSTRNRRVTHLSANFQILTKVSLLTWNFVEHPQSIEMLEQQIQEIKCSAKYAVWPVRFFVGIACGSLCLLAGGGIIDGLFAFFASLLGLIVRQEFTKKGFNVMIAVVCSAFVTTTISGLDVFFNVGTSPEKAVATAVLFLIPGIPLINCIIDLIEGYIPTAIARGAFGGFVLLCIAIGMFLSMHLIGISKF